MLQFSVWTSATSTELYFQTCTEKNRFMAQQKRSQESSDCVSSCFLQKDGSCNCLWMLELIWLVYLSPSPHFWQPTRALLYGLAVSILATQPTKAKLFIHLLTAACLSLLQSVWRSLVVKGSVTVSEASGPRSNNNSWGPERWSGRGTECKEMSTMELTNIRETGRGSTCTWPARLHLYSCSFPLIKLQRVFSL